MRNFFFFDKMITPKIINIVYWFAILGAVISGVISMQNPFGGGLLVGLGTIIGGVIAARISCELIIVLFKINESLLEIRHK